MCNCNEANVQNAVQTQAPPVSCPSGCCTGTEILCVSIPCPVSIVLLGIDLTLELPCLRLTSGTPLSGAGAASLLQTITTILGGIGTAVGATK